MEGQYRLQELEWVFRLAYRKMSIQWNKQLEQKGVSPSQAFIIETLGVKGPQKVSEIAEALGTTLSAVTGISDRLISHEYIQRERCETDRRIVRLILTPNGEEVLFFIQEERKKLMSQLFRGLPEEDLHGLIRIYKQILHNIETESKE